MDPLPSAINTLVNTLQGLAQTAGGTPVQAAPLPALMALAGQDAAMILLGQAAEGGVSLQLPSGQVITAQGQMPYPEGTQLLVRVLAGGADGAVRLQTLQAAPPATPAILAPLNQGEASLLQASLAQADPPEALASLAQLFRQLGGGQPEAPPGARAEILPPGPPLPDATRIQAALPALPASAQAALKAILNLPPDADSAATATSLEGWLAAGRSAEPGAAQDPAQRLAAALERHPEVPPAQAGPLLAWLKGLPAAPETRPAPAAAQGEAAPAPAAAQGSAAARPGAPAAPETWEGWIRGSLKALADPAASPQSAPFHAAQAREGTAYFEIPLPWAPNSPLQMWVESDRDPRDPKGDRSDTQRVLLGLSFSNLGETRLGIARSGGNLQVRVWTEHPEPLEGCRAAMAAELEDLGGSVDLKIFRLAPGPGGTVPSLRSQVAGSTLQALG
jgi:hypothetical protein